MVFATSLLVISVAFGINVWLTSPTAAVPKDQRVVKDYPTVHSLALKMYKSSCWIHGIIEILILTLPVVAQHLPPSITTQWIINAFFDIFLPGVSPGKEKTIFFPPLRILGAFLILFGSTTRYLCYRELGRHYTFHVTILDKHTLVTTGPYSVVRHPSYSAVVFLNIGSILWHATSGSWLIQSRLYTHTISWIGFLPLIITIAGGANIVINRPKEEDKLLKKEFGKKWDEWAKRVPYRLFPGIY